MTEFNVTIRNLCAEDPEIFAREERAQGWLGATPEKLEMRLSDCAAAFLLPLSLLLDKVGFNTTAAASISALVQFFVFFWLTRNRKLTPKH